MRTAILMAMIGALPVCALAQDGPTIMRRLRSAYAALTSYAHQTSVTVALRGDQYDQVAGNTGVTRYRKPNRLYVSVTNPQSGTLVSASNGREQIIYRSKWNQFERRPAPATLAAAIKSLAAIEVDTSLLDPLYFLQGKALPPTVTDVVTRGTASVNGVSCYVVVGTIRSRARVTFWVDRKSYLLRKMQVVYNDLPITVPIPRLKNGKRVTERRRILFRGTISEVIQEIQINPPLDDSAFNFVVPKGAIERNLDRLLKR